VRLRSTFLFLLLSGQMFAQVDLPLRVDSWKAKSYGEHSSLTLAEEWVPEQRRDSSNGNYFSIDAYPELYGGLATDLIFESSLGLGLDVKYNKFKLNLVPMGSSSRYSDYMNQESFFSRNHPNGGVLNWNIGQNHYNSFFVKGNFEYRASDRFQFSFGNSENFLGEGYRSLLLSEFASNFLNVKLKAKVWRFKYLFMIGQMRDNSIRPVKKYWDQEARYTAFHYMSWNVTRKINLAFFESVIWRGQDTTLSRGVEVQYLNPVIFWRPVEYAQGSTDNSIIGLNASFKNKGLTLYHQLVLDEFLLGELRAGNGWWANKYGLQFGAKYEAGCKENRFRFLAEYNLVRPFTYAHKTSLESYSHMGRPLAHPQGANFTEFVSEALWSNGPWDASLQYFVLNTGYDTQGVSYGQNVLRSYEDRSGTYGHKIGQGISTTIQHLQLHLRRDVWNAVNLKANLIVGYRNRNSINSVKEDFYLLVGLNTGFNNIPRFF
jgi:hypothetical protein